MLYYLLYKYSVDYNSVFNVFKYITFRTVCSILTSMFLAFLIGPYFIKRFAASKIGQVVRSDGPLTHLTKTGTPTMVGIWILISVVVSSLLWSRLDNMYGLYSLLFHLLGSSVLSMIIKNYVQKKVLVQRKNCFFLLYQPLLHHVFYISWAFQHNWNCHFLKIYSLN